MSIRAYIRTYKRSDYQTILDIYAASKLDELRFERSAFELLPLEEDSKRRDALFESEIFVFDAEHVLGFGAMYPSSSARDSEIRAVFVLPSARGNGIGRSLLRYMITRCPGNILLQVASRNHYTKAGQHPDTRGRRHAYHGTISRQHNTRTNSMNSTCWYKINVSFFYLVNI